MLKQSMDLRYNKWTWSLKKTLIQIPDIALMINHIYKTVYWKKYYISGVEELWSTKKLNNNFNRKIVEELLAKMASRVGNCLQLRVIKTYKNLNHRNLITTTYNQIRQLSKTSSPSPSGNFQLSHLNPAVIEKIEKQIATQGIAIHRL